jgi:peptidoglycan biosynthesis protein MviN/MurJ (putative lipid II flippase)
LAFSLGSILNLAVLWVILRLKAHDLGEARILRPIAIMCAAALLMAIAMQGAKTVLGSVVDMRTFVGIFTQGAVAGVLGLGVYVGASALFGSEDARRVMTMYRRKAVPVPTSELGQEGETIVAE